MRARGGPKVKFANEDGVDEGGVAREYFRLLSEQLFSPEYGMFRYIYRYTCKTITQKPYDQWLGSGTVISTTLRKK
mgnify:CR=1 FL=1